MKSNKYILATILLILAVVLVRNAWVCDDSYITFRTVDNFTHGYGLTWNVTERVQAFTHPLWMLLLSLVYLFTSEIYYTSLIISILLILGTAWLISFRIAATFEISLIAIFLLMISKPFIDFSVSGLENPLTHFLLALFLYFYLKNDKSPKNIFYLCLSAALITVNRLDISLLIAPALLYAYLTSENKLVALRYALLGFLPLFCWELFSLIYYGFPFPNTAYAKLNTGIARADLVSQGYRYYIAGLKWSPLTVGLTIISPLILLIKKQGKIITGSLGIILYLCYILYIGGDFMSGRFFSAPFLFAVILLSQFKLKSSWVVVPILTTLFGYALIFPHTPLLSSADFGSGIEAKRWYYGVADERAGWYQSTGLLNQSSGEYYPNHQWVKDGLALKDNATFVNRTGIGFLGYFAGPIVHIVDGHALANPFLARLPARDKKVWRIGHFHHIIPDGYEATIQSETNQIEDSSLAKYYDKLSILTRSKIFSWERLKEIYKFNTGAYQYLVDDYVFSLTVLNYNQISAPKVQGTAYNAKGCHVFGIEDSLIVNFDQATNATVLEVSVDHNDDYDFSFFLNQTEIGRARLPQHWIEERGLRIDTVIVPDSIAERSYNYIHIKGVEGDGKYSLGHLRIIP